LFCSECISKLKESLAAGRIDQLDM